jgi:hypothetical protein
MTAIPTGLKWNLNVILICNSFMAENVEHFFMYLLAICTFFHNCSFAHLSVGLFVPLMFNFFSSLCSLDINPMSIEQLAKIFYHSLGCLFILGIVSFAVQKLFSSMQSHLLILAFIS